MDIRLMTPRDYDAVRALWDETPGVGLNNVDDSREGIEKYLRRNPTTSFVAEQDGTLLGVILCGHDGRRGFIYHTAVRENCRSRGIGKALVAAALQALCDEGISKSALVVFRSNDTGNQFWEARGFTLRDDLMYRNISLNPNVR